MKKSAEIFNGLLKEFCRNEGVTEFSVTTASPFYHTEALLSDFSGKSGAEFCERDIKKRVDPSLTLINAKSIICLLFPYKVRAGGGSDGGSDGFKKGVLQGKISSGDVWLGCDYHIFIRQRLAALCAVLKDVFGGNYMPFCDTGPLIDKAVAVRAGLCGVGINNLALNKRLGTHFYISYILTDNDFSRGTSCDENDRLFFEVSPLCNGCRKCVNACPASAISVRKPFDASRCVSYLSQKRGGLSSDEAKRLGDSLYGCIVCQSVCPLNKTENFVKYVDLDENTTLLSNREFSRKFADTAAGFIGKKIFLRNAAAVEQNAENKNKEK